jgi:UDP-N-acetylmuramoyl-L-alanyl-D-glutamate--2,6-diaminopimelate ligase
VTAPLSTVVRALRQAEQHGHDVEVVDATHDSRQVAPGWLFCAIPGAKHDGHDHASDAVERGAAALLVERWLDLPVPQVRVPSVRAAVGPAAGVVHGRPSERLTVIGITGTNGKTTIAYLLEAAAAASGRGTGVIGTVEARINGEREEGVRTTPEGTDLQRLLARMEGRGAEVVAMEVSSHGLDLRRVDGTRFSVAAFTNLSQDHLDWHGSMEAYFAAKARLFDPGFAEHGVVVTDDRWGRRLAEQASIPLTTVGRHRDADVRIVDERSHVTGGWARLVWGDDEVEVTTHLTGDFNLTNAVVAVVSATTAGIPRDAAIAGVAACPGAPGRLERVRPDHPVRVFVDYAHSPDAVRAVLETLRGSLEPGGRLLLVLGAGGDRDRGKRAGMGAAATLADVAVLTSDNPRSEDPEVILDALAAGAEQADPPADHVVLRESDRRLAIGMAIDRARPGDVVLVAGKGHETTQEMGDRVVTFDDREVAASFLDGTGDEP